MSSLSQAQEFIESRLNFLTQKVNDINSKNNLLFIESSNTNKMKLSDGILHQQQLNEKLSFLQQPFSLRFIAKLFTISLFLCLIILYVIKPSFIMITTEYKEFTITNPKTGQQEIDEYEIQLETPKLNYSQLVFYSLIFSVSICLILYSAQFIYNVFFLKK